MTVCALTVPEGASWGEEVEIQWLRQMEELHREASHPGGEAKGSRVGAPAVLGSWDVGNCSVMLHTDAIHSSLAAARGSHSSPTGTACARPGPRTDLCPPLPLHNHVSSGES